MCASYTCGSSRGTVTTGGRYCATCNLGTIFRGQTLDVGTVGLTGASLLQGRAMLWLQDAAGNVVASNQGYQNTWNAYITYTATASGTYTLYEGIPNFSARSPTGTQGYDTVTATPAWALTALPRPVVSPPPPPSIQYNQCAQFSSSSRLMTNLAGGSVFANCAANLNAGQVLQFGTAQLPGAQYSGSVFLWLRNSAGAVLTSGSGTGAPLVYTIPADGHYIMSEGCTSLHYACSGTLSWAVIGTVTLSPPPPMVASPPPRTTTTTKTSTTSGSTSGSGSMSGPGTCAPYSAALGTTMRCNVYAGAGSTLTVGTTGVAGAACTGDTKLWLVNPAGTTVANNDDSGSTRCSRIQYQVPTSGTYVILEGCYSSTSCTGTVAYTR